jgi:glycosyltransferase involved in cell wall biosynthesis
MKLEPPFVNLLYLSNGYPPLQRAGTEVYTAAIASAFVRAGHQVEVVCSGEWDAGERAFNGVTREQHAGVALTRLNLNWAKGPDPNRYLYDNPETEAALDEYLEQSSPDLVHITSCYTLSASIIRSVRRRRLPLLITLTDFWFLCPRVTLLRSDGARCDGRTNAWECLRCLLARERVYRVPAKILPEAALGAPLTWVSRQPWLSRRRGLRGLALDMRQRKARLRTLLEEADGLISPSHFVAEVYRDNGVQRDIQVVPYGHDIGWAKDILPRPVTAPLTFGFIGRITPAKGLHVLIEALRHLSAELPLRVDVWGDPRQEADYVRTLPALDGGHPPLRFRGHFGRGQMAEVFNQIDVLVVPSVWYENSPLVVHEAFAAGKPVIASTLGGLTEAVTHRVSGLVFAPGDARALAAQIQEVTVHPELIGRLRQGIPPVKTIEEEVDALTQLYGAVGSRSCTSGFSLETPSRAR